MSQDLRGKSCVILMPTCEDWPSICHMLPIIDRALEELGATARVIVVEDGSVRMAGKEQIAGLSLKAIQRIDEIVLGCNQGNQRAIAIGLAYVATHIECDYLVVMDSDNEDKPEFVPKLLTVCKERGSDKVIFARRSRRSEGPVFAILYSFYRGLFKALTGIEISVGNFCAIPGAYLRRIAFIDALWNHFPASIMRSRLPWESIRSERGERIFGNGKMNFVSLVVHAFSGFSIYADVIAVRTMMAALAMGGFFLLTLGVTTGIKIETGSDILIPGWTSLMMMIIFLLFAVVLSAALIMLLFVLLLRTQPKLIPIHDYVRFVEKTRRLFPAEG